ncbi:MAG TPA: cytochrome c [Ignavibacteria bacterium]|nr:cytochrome c [Ignavibacteria bacterium]
MSNIEKEKNGALSKVPVNKAKIFSLAYIYILLIWLGIGLFYLSKMDQIARNTIPPAIQDTMKVEPSEIKLQMPKTTQKANVFVLSQPSNLLIQRGKKLFNNYCITCHGTNGKGDGVAAAALKPSPRNFTTKKGWVNGPKLVEIYKTLSDGIQGSSMMEYDQFSPKQKFALAQYIRSAFVPNPPKDTKEELNNLIQTYKLNEIEKNPGQIPIRDAMILIERGAQSKYHKILSILKSIQNDAVVSEGARIFNSVTKDKIRALTTLINTNEWHNNQKVFIDLIVHELNEDGFNEKVHDLSDVQWSDLFNYLNKLFS